uniref:creatine kinase n=1 Tax=Hucho hucho TaxID=62062 RepID=A0A4W5R8V3_9TELE
MICFRLLIYIFRIIMNMWAELPGKLYSRAELSHDKDDKGVTVGAPSLSQLRNGVARDWPDSRDVWSVLLFKYDANIAEAFQCICVVILKVGTLGRHTPEVFIWKQQLGWVVSSPADVGTGLRARVRVKLQHLPRRPQETAPLEVYNISNAQTIGLDAVGFTQLVVDGVKLLIRMKGEEKIDDLVPLQK